MQWNWILFVVLFFVFTIISLFSRGAMNRKNVETYGGQADYRNEPGFAFLGSVIAGSIFSACATALIGFFL